MQWRVMENKETRGYFYRHVIGVGKYEV